MNAIPGFTAEASLYNASTSYQAASEAAVHGGLVQPAGPLSDYANADTPFPSLGPVYTPRPVWCLMRRCKDVAPPGHPPFLLCWTVVGIWNSVTHRCE
jgi:hypothetical protein